MERFSPRTRLFVHRVTHGVKLSFKVRFDRVLFLTDINQSESFCIGLYPLLSLTVASIFGCVKESLERAA